MDDHLNPLPGGDRTKDDFLRFHDPYASRRIKVCMCRSANLERKLERTVPTCSNRFLTPYVECEVSRKKTLYPGTKPYTQEQNPLLRGTLCRVVGMELISFVVLQGSMCRASTIKEASEGVR